VKEAILFNGEIKVNTDGQVFKYKKDHWKEIGKPNGINQYRNVSVHVDGKLKTVRAHRLIAIAFIPNPEGKPEVNHIDGNRENNSVTNLEWVTRSENCMHAIRTGLYKGIQNTCQICGGKTHNHDDGHCTCNTCRQRFGIARHSSPNQPNVIRAREIIALEKRTSDEQSKR
jgi:hypothetical protein